MVSNCRLTSQPYRPDTRHLPQKEERLLVHDRRIACGRTLWLRYSAAEVMKDAVHGLGVEEADSTVGEVCELGLVLQRHNPHARQRGLWSHTGGSAPPGLGLSRIRANTQSESGLSPKHVWSNGTMLGALSEALLVGLQLIRLINVEILRNAPFFQPHSTALTARHGDPVRPKGTNCGGGESLAILPRVLKRLVRLLFWDTLLVCVLRTPVYSTLPTLSGHCASEGFTSELVEGDSSQLRMYVAFLGLFLIIQYLPIRSEVLLKQCRSSVGVQSAVSPRCCMYSIDYVFSPCRPLRVSFPHGAQPHCASASHPSRHAHAASLDR